MVICTNVMTLAKRPMNDSVYALTSDDRDGTMILMMNVMTTQKPMGGLFAISECRTTEDRIIVTTRTTMSLCTMTCCFRYDLDHYYSFYDKRVINDSIAKLSVSASDTSIPISRPIPIRASVTTFKGDVDVQTP